MKRRANSKRTTSRRNTPTQKSESEGQESELQDLFLDELADIEKQILKALPRMAKAAQSEELRDAFESHLQETEQQVSRLEQAAKAMGESLQRKSCKGMQGIIEEGQEMMKEKEDSSALDAALIAASQKVEHYEIASCGSLKAWAEQMDEQQVVELLQQNQEEEEAADEKLTKVAETIANQRAAAK
jgi:ferritin-like metal-binding protein YciE